MWRPKTREGSPANVLVSALKEKVRTRGRMRYRFHADWGTANGSAKAARRRTSWIVSANKLLKCGLSLLQGVRNPLDAIG